MQKFSKSFHIRMTPNVDVYDVGMKLELWCG